MPGSWGLRWNNPKIHTPDRRKIWLACEDHKESLSSFLSARGFLKEVEPHGG
ncbi:acetone carboxylase [Nocardioides sp. Kera G14]|uniref:acetone carboxylase n=1 Tax=Nocardioides sp. Kera G14 TaxID=2884264 RepID=UPI001D11BBC4|nr:acetone carboxylase [Nocardioides sp. Kera G14]UDY25364.1 acetone carboxylase [Nocardioides sp. Kera G14]